MHTLMHMDSLTPLYIHVMSASPRSELGPSSSHSRCASRQNSIMARSSCCNSMVTLLNEMVAFRIFKVLCLVIIGQGHLRLPRTCPHMVQHSRAFGPLMDHTLSSTTVADGTREPKKHSNNFLSKEFSAVHRFSENHALRQAATHAQNTMRAILFRKTIAVTPVFCSVFLKGHR